MRIAYFASPYSIHDTKWINYFAREHDIIVFCENEEGKKSLLTSKVILYPILPKTFPFLNIFTRKITLRKCNQLLSLHKIDLVHSMYAYPNAIWASYCKVKSHIITTRGSDILIDYNKTLKSPTKLHELIVYPFLRRLLEQALIKSQFITSTSLEQQKQIIKLGIKEEKLFLIRTGVDAELFLKDYLPGSKADNFVTIFCPRGLKSLYNIDLILDAFKEIIKRHPDLIFHLNLINYLTEDWYLEEIQSTIQLNGLSNQVKIVPLLDASGIKKLYSEATIVIMIPKSDGTPVSGIEAMLSKTPLIIGPLAYDPDLFNQDTVWKAMNFTIDEICNTITTVLKLPVQEKNQKLTNAYNTALKLANLKTETLKVMELYKAVLKNPKVTNEFYKTNH
jgi:glycosyltransferase involved in cell wall biosynthesis